MCKTNKSKFPQSTKSGRTGGNPDRILDVHDQHMSSLKEKQVNPSPLGFHFCLELDNMNTSDNLS